MGLTLWLVWQGWQPQSFPPAVPVINLSPCSPSAELNLDCSPTTTEPGWPPKCLLSWPWSVSPASPVHGGGTPSYSFSMERESEWASELQSSVGCMPKEQSHCLVGKKEQYCVASRTVRKKLCIEQCYLGIMLAGAVCNVILSHVYG